MGGDRVLTASSHFDRASLHAQARVLAMEPTCVDAMTRAHRTAFANKIDRGRSGAFLHDAPRALLHLLSAVARRRRPVRFPPLHPRALHCHTRDCPILRPRAGLPLSLEGLRLSPFAMSFGATCRTRFPSSLRHSVGCCMSAPRHFKRPSSTCNRLCSHAAECTHAA